MDSDQGRLRTTDVTHFQDHRFFGFLLHDALERVDPEMAEPAGKIGLGDLVQLK